MRLLNTSTLKLQEFVGDANVKYAILSHRWEDEEVSLQQLMADDVHGKKGHQKIVRCCQEAAKAGLQYAWIDTCCIDKTSSAELQEAINSMFRWYQQAAICYAYLCDVHDLDDFANSAWFTRGWTLQELIAPKEIHFYNHRWKLLGTKTSLQRELSEITNVPERVLRTDNLRNGNLRNYSVARRMSWASKRVTTRPEDLAYCLLGLFDVNMTMIYGEGTRAFTRLQEEIIRVYDDQSIFAWKCKGGSGPEGLFAPSTDRFESCGDLSQRSRFNPEPFSMTNIGLSISLPMRFWTKNTFVALLDCSNVDHLLSQGLPLDDGGNTAIFLQRYGSKGQFTRTTYLGQSILKVGESEDLSEYQERRIFILPQVGPPVNEVSFILGFEFRMTTNPLFNVCEHGNGNFAIQSTNPPTRCRPNKPAVWEVELSAGEQGVRIDLTRSENNTSKIGLVYFGFDFDSNPVCLLINRAQMLRDETTTTTTTTTGSSGSSSLFRYTTAWINEHVASHGIKTLSDLRIEWGKINQPAEIEQPVETYCALQGNKHASMIAAIRDLNILVKMQKGDYDYRPPRETWIVEITTLNKSTEVSSSSEKDDSVSSEKTALSPLVGPEQNKQSRGEGNFCTTQCAPRVGGGKTVK